MKIGVISDTHNHLDPRVHRLFSDVDHILHGGDIGLPAILLELESIAPVTAVLGNTDDPCLGYRETEVVNLGGRTFMIHHIVDPGAASERINLRIARERPSVVVFGHTHKPFCEMIDGTLFLNPGYAGRERFRMPRSLALLHCAPGGITPEFLEL